MKSLEDLLLDDRKRWLLSKLERIMDRIDQGDLPMVISEVYLFGSFLKNEEFPKDIDILVLYDSNMTAEMYEHTDSSGKTRWMMWNLRTSPSRLRGCLKKNPERSVDLNICPTLEAFQNDLEYEMDIWLSIWTPEDRDWKGKLFNHFLSLRE